MLQEIKQYYISDRLSKIDQDFLEFEEEQIDQDSLDLIYMAVTSNVKLPNPHNSIILYLTGVTDDFNLLKGRSDTIGGTPPDIDIDFGSKDRDIAKDWIVEKWGRDYVANIGTFGTLKPKGLTRKYFSIHEPDADLKEEEKNKNKLAAHFGLRKKILSKIPDPLFGKEPTLEEVINGNPDKGYKPHPELATESEFADWYAFASRLENMVNQFGIHAGGLVISDFPVADVLPLWKKAKDPTLITQLDMNAVEELGMIKFDLLAVKILDVLQETKRLIKKHQDIDVDIYNIEDGDKAAYDLLASGLLTGIFQMETSGSAKDLIMAIKPSSILELSDISALNRPGPLENGFHETYINNKNNGYPPSGLHPAIAELTKDTYWTLVYQEQVMGIVSQIAGFSLREADDVRRAMGKKKMNVLEAVKPDFINGAVKKGMEASYAEEVWEMLLKFANYGFNKSHSVCYSYITYVCAYLKANYTLEYFTALMTIKSKTMQPKDWAVKAPEYINEAQQLGVSINPPNIQVSGIGFTIRDGEIYFGFKAIKDVGSAASKSIVRTRGNKRFSDIWDFVNTIDTSQVNTKTFEALVKAGAFDRMGYLREELVENSKEIYSYLPSLEDYYNRISENEEREKNNQHVENMRKELDDRIKKAKEEKKRLKKLKQEVPDSVAYDADLKKMLKTCRELETKDQLDLLSPKQMQDWEKYGNLRKKVILKVPEKPEKVNLVRVKQVRINTNQLIEQAGYIGCYLGTHPAQLIWPESIKIVNALEGDYITLSGAVTNIHKIRTRHGDPMCFIALGDGTAVGEAVIFPKVYKRLMETLSVPKEQDLIKIMGKVQKADPTVSIIADEVEVYRSN